MHDCTVEVTVGVAVEVTVGVAVGAAEGAVGLAVGESGLLRGGEGEDVIRTSRWVGMSGNAKDEV